MKPSRLIAFGGTVIGAGAAMALLFTALRSPIVQAAPNGNGGAMVLNLSVGSSHACVMMTNGRLLCWGSQSGASPVLGDGSSATRLMPVDVVNITGGATSVAGGGTVSCAIVNGGVKCWGGNTHGQLGTGNNSVSSVPTDVVGLSSGVTSIAAGVNYACAIAAGGAAKCWGVNDNGQLGNNSNQPSNVPVDVVGLSSNVSAIATRQNHTCAVVNGGAKCWGANGSGQLGNGNTSPSQVPLDVSGLPTGSNVTAIAIGAAHSCAIVNGGVKCWGDNLYGELGTGNLGNSDVPSNVLGLSSGVTAIAVGGYHVCALTTGGGVKCWGRNDDGQLGISNTQSISVPLDVVGLTSGVTAIAAGGNAANNNTTCALLASGQVKCWGNSVALGTGFSAGNALTPRTVLGLPDECIFTTASGGDDWANARNWSNCGGAIPQAGDNVVIGRPSTSGIIPQLYATTTVSLNRLRVIGSFFMYGTGTVNHVFDDNIANLNPNLNQNYFRFIVSGPGLTVTQRLTWTIGYLDGTGNVIIQPGAVGTVQGTSPSIVNAVDAHVRNFGTFNMNNAEMGSQWSNESGGVMNFTGDVYCCGTSGGVFNNRGTVNITGTNRIQPIFQYSGAINVNGIVTRTTNFFGMTLYGGSLNGTGIISDAVDNVGGVVAPGGPNNAGSLIIADYYRQSPTATLSIDIGGSITGTFDQLKMSNTGEEPFYPGRATLSGTLNLNQLNSFTPQSGDEIRFMTFNQRNGFFGTFNNAFAPGFIPAAYANYVALIEGSGANVRMSARAEAYAVQPGANNDYTIAFENPFTQTITLQAITHTLPISITYRPGSTIGAGDPTITTSNGRQQLRWGLAQPIGAANRTTFKFGVTVNPSATIGTYISTIAAHTSANVQDVMLPSAAAMLIQEPTTVSNTFDLPGAVIPRGDLPPLINVTRGNSDEPFLVQTYLACPPGHTCNDPNTDIFSVTLKVAGFSYTMTAGIAPPTPTLMIPSLRGVRSTTTQSHFTPEEIASRSALATLALPARAGATNLDRPAWANPPPYFHWEPGWPCDQQLPKERCDPGPDNPYRTPDCPIPIVIVIHWADGSITEELIACGALYDPSGYVRQAFTNQPITNATVSLYKVPFALPDTSTQTRDCRTIETRPGGISGTWQSLPPANISTGLLEDPSFSPPRIDPPVNPQLTDDQGHYGWDVTTGCWFVVVSAPGYVTKISPAVGVPPAVTDLDMYLLPEGAFKVYLPLVRK